MQEVPFFTYIFHYKKEGIDAQALLLSVCVYCFCKICSLFVDKSKEKFYNDLNFIVRAAMALLNMYSTALFCAA